MPAIVGLPLTSFLLCCYFSNIILCLVMNTKQPYALIAVALSLSSQSWFPIMLLIFHGVMCSAQYCTVIQCSQFFITVHRVVLPSTRTYSFIYTYAILLVLKKYIWPWLCPTNLLTYLIVLNSY